MRYLKIISFVISIIASNALRSQVSVNVNIGTPPLWGPVYVEERYYYLPDVEAYYDIETSMFIYFGNGVWLHRASLPSRYRSYDLYNGYKVVMTGYHGHTPYNDFHVHKVKYKKGYKGGPQKTIGNKPGKGNNKSTGSGNHQKSQQKNSSGNKQNKVGGGGNHHDGGNKGGGKSGGGKGKK
ncbi:MAG: hypothetical protein K0S53_1966 [Bacteroidetes bacterium]|nr:hypothetical protein [Bacteroidota bacterium]MDF2451032.1 hypothetical protein [Bacteroidota bacterium]